MHRHINYIFISLMGAACYLPKLYIFTDRLLLPKWYALMSVLFIWMLYITITVLCKKKYIVGFPCLEYAKTAVIALAVCECVYVILHVLINGIDVTGERGSFDNPSGLALCISIPMAMILERIVVSKRMTIRLYGSLCILLFVSVIILSRSRTGIISVAALTVWYIVKVWGKPRLPIYGIVLCILAITVSIVVMHKKDSTLGRYFILSNSCHLISEHPIKGYGHDGFELNYMTAQAEYFWENPDSRYIMLADEIHHPLNEFVDVWIKYGILGPMFLLSVFVNPAIIGYKHKAKHLMSVLPPMLVIFVFCFFSYPLNYPLPWCVLATGFFMTARHSAIYAKACELVDNKISLVALTTSILVCFFSLLHSGYNEYRWNQAWYHLHKNTDTTLDEYAVLYPHMSENRYFLYNYAFALYSKGHFDESLAVMNECLNYWNGYNLQLLMGDACRMSSKCSEAIIHYNLAHNMCPARLAPFEGLYLAYDSLKDYNSRGQIARKIATQKVKVPSYDAYRIKLNYK